MLVIELMIICVKSVFGGVAEKEGLPWRLVVTMESDDLYDF